MTKVSNRDKKTAAQQGILPSTAASVKRLLSKARNDLDESLTKPKGWCDENGNYNGVNSVTTQQLVERLQQYFFGTNESFPYTQTSEELRELKRWIEGVASTYFMLDAISLYEACYLAEFNHTNRVGVIRELAARSKRFNIMLRVVNECIMMRTSLRRFTKDEQNNFMHG